MRSCVYRPVGVNLGGLVGSVGRSASGSPLISRTMRNFSSTPVMTGRTFCATGLYFFLALGLGFDSERSVSAKRTCRVDVVVEDADVCLGDEVEGIELLLKIGIGGVVLVELVLGQVVLASDRAARTKADCV